MKINTVFEVLNRQNSWELALSSAQCQCIMLIEQDLELYRIVFGADWDRYILLTRFDTAEEFQAALTSGRLPNVLLDGETVSLPAMLVFLMMHEVGHLSTRPFLMPSLPKLEGLTEYIVGLNPQKAEELRADAYVAHVLSTACFGRDPQDLLLHSCIAPSMLSLLTFVVGMKGKSHESLCLRYLDVTDGYPNWQARLLLLDFLLLPESLEGRANVVRYLATRRGLLEKDWILSAPECARAAAFSQTSTLARE